MITFSSDAEEDIGRLRSFLEKINRDVARRALDRLWSSITRIEAFPLLGVATENPNIRQLIVPFGSAGYVVRYFIDPLTDGIIITRIWHSREERQ